MFMFLEQIDGRLRQSSCPPGCLNQKRDLLILVLYYVFGSKYEKVHTKIKVEA
ncbi:similar to RIKEN cDNA 1810020D17 (predicted), isoform CRA_c [Rattus norvegicus]|uniref:Similar to RIKEN cDNA 1810020D17 (Predicted), isoform CRA_c n=1 Tax=Rattus norvegicus TaxID=10116 RepID=A6I6A1_RAT|nr:similar to RIKEN cDNA 1810020D17 (predicted), isoform CRA_c [Rattus norvegicus]